MRKKSLCFLHGMFGFSPVKHAALKFIPSFGLCIAIMASLFAAVIVSGTATASVSPQVSAGEHHSIALKNDGTVWAWGNNDYGQLGDGTKTDSNVPVQVSGLSDVAAITAGGYHCIALKSDSTVWTWGWNAYGQLGDGSTANSVTPVRSTRLSSISAITGGGYHSLALKSDGVIWAWGRNNYGQLGDGTTNDRTTQVQVVKLSKIAFIAGGKTHSVALKSDGTVWAWGYNVFGQLGNKTTTNSATPVQVKNINLGQTTTPTPTPSSTPVSTPTPSSSPVPTLTPAPTTLPGTPIPLPTVSPGPNEKGTVFGYVYDADGNPLEGVTVTITGADYSDSTETDSIGYYEFEGLDAGDYTLSYEKEDYQSMTNDITIEEGEEQDVGKIIMELVTYGKIYGYVVNIYGDPIESVKLRLKGVKTKVTKNTSSDADGFFEFTDLDEDVYMVLATKKRYKNYQKTIKLEEGQEKKIEIEMRRFVNRQIMMKHENQ